MIIESFPGTKSFVFNAPKSNLLMVLAETKTSDRKGDMSNSMTIFLVDSSAPGVTIHKKDNTIGCNELYQSKVSFKNVVLQPGMSRMSKVVFQGNLIAF